MFFSVSVDVYHEFPSETRQLYDSTARLRGNARMRLLVDCAANVDKLVCVGAATDVSLMCRFLVCESEKARMLVKVPWVRIENANHLELYRSRRNMWHVWR